MKSIFDPAIRASIALRIQTLDEHHQNLWGKMNVHQMVDHCTRCDDMMQGKINIKRVFIGRLIGRTLLKKVSQNEKAFGKNSPTSPLLLSPGEKTDLTSQKNEWLNRVHQYSSFTNNSFVYPFFGPMTNEQIGQFVYKHIDHHLRQFGV